MNTNRLSKTIEVALNTQMTKEAHASQIYLSYAAWKRSSENKLLKEFTVLTNAVDESAFISSRSFFRFQCYNCTVPTENRQSRM